VITGVHSIVMIDSTTVSAIFDIVPDTSGSGLHFEFELPKGCSLAVLSSMLVQRCRWSLLCLSPELFDDFDAVSASRESG